MKTFEIKIEPKTTSGTAKVFLSGSFIIQNIAEIKDQLIVLLQDYNELEIIAENIDDFDISCIQIFYALSKSASHLDKKITYQIDLPEEISNVLSHSGFKNLLVPKAELS